MAQRVVIASLNVDQVEAIEIALATPVDEWAALRSRMKVMRVIYSLATGVDDATIGSMGYKELAEAIVFTEDAETENPTQPDPSSG